MAVSVTFNSTIGHALIRAEYIALMTAPQIFTILSLFKDFIVIDIMTRAVPI
jgi:hypothetical protein